MTTTTTPALAAILANIEEAPTHALGWLMLADWLEENRSGRCLSCLKCEGEGLLPTYESPGRLLDCPACRGAGRVWVPNPDIARAREMPVLFGDACPHLFGGRMWEWKNWGGEHPRNRRDTHEVPAWLFALLKPRSGNSYCATYTTVAEAKADLHAAACRFARGACGVGTSSVV